MYFYVNRVNYAYARFYVDMVLSDVWFMFHNLKNLISRENKKNVCTIY